MTGSSLTRFNPNGSLVLGKESNSVALAEDDEERQFVNFVIAVQVGVCYNITRQ
jgi:hypothetical protein